MRKTLQALAAFLLLLAWSCQKEESPLIGQTGNTPSSQPLVGDKMVLGRKLENPYSVENMRKAFALLSPQSKSSVGQNAEDVVHTTHYYIKFKPQNERELDLLKCDSNLILYPYPLDYEILVYGEYHDPAVPDSLPTYQYASVEVGHPLPTEVVWEKLADLYIPDEYGDEDNMEILTRAGSAIPEAFIDELSKYTQDYRKKAENIRVREKLNTQDLVATATKGLIESKTVENVKVEIVDREPLGTDIPTNVPTLNSEQEHTNEPQDSQQNHLETNNTSQSTSPQTQNGGNVQLEGGKQINYAFTYKHSDYKFHIILEMNDPAMDWLLIERLADTEYNLFINMRHSFFKPLIDKSEFLPIMMRMSIALALAEIDVMVTSHDGRIEPSAIRLKMNEILETVRKGEEEL